MTVKREPIRRKNIHIMSVWKQVIAAANGPALRANGNAAFAIRTPKINHSPIMASSMVGGSFTFVTLRRIEGHRALNQPIGTAAKRLAIAQTQDCSIEKRPITGGSREPIAVIKPSAMKW